MFLTSFGSRRAPALVATGLIAPEQLALAEPKNKELADLACPVFAAAKAAG